MAQSINLEQFIAKSKQRKQDRMKLSKVYVKGYDAEFTLVSLGFNRITEMMDGIEMGCVSEQMNFYKDLIYASMPILKSPEIQEAHACAEPFDIVFEVFTMDEVNAIAEQILSFNGIDISEDELKNSSGPTKTSS